MSCTVDRLTDGGNTDTADEVLNLAQVWQARRGVIPG